MRKNGNSKEPRTALLIRCTEEEAKAIHEAASLQRRTVSAFVLQAVMNRIAINQRLEAAVRKPLSDSQSRPSASESV